MTLLIYITVLIMARSMSPTTFNEEQKSNPHFSDKFSGKTVRNKSRRKPRSENAIVSHYRNVTSDDNISVIPITDIDKQFDILDVSVPSIRRNHGSFVINSRQLWESFEDSLTKTHDTDQSTYSHAKKFDSSSRRIDEIFKIPVTGTIEVPNISSETKGISQFTTKKMFSISGREYDPDFLYTRTGTEFTFDQSAPLVIPMPLFQSEHVKQLPFNAVAESGSRLHFAQLSHVYHNASVVSKESRLDIMPDARNYTDNGTIIAQFNSPQTVTDIGVVGRIPRVTAFTKRMRTKRGHRKYKIVSGGCIYLLDDTEHTNISMFTLYYRNVDNKKWVHVGTFNGTQSMLKEHVINLSHHFNIPQGIYTDSLKFVAKNPEELYMRIAIYGIITPIEQKIGTCDSSTDMVTYSVEKNSTGKWNFDNYTCNCRMCRAYKTRRLFRKGKSHRSMIEEITAQIDSSDMSGEFSCVAFEFDSD